MCFSLSIVGPSEKSTTNWRWVPGKEKCTGFVLVSSKQSLTGGSKTTTGLGKAPPPKKKLIWENFPKYLNTPQCTAVFLWDLEHKRWNLAIFRVLWGSFRPVWESATPHTRMNGNVFRNKTAFFEGLPLPEKVFTESGTFHNFQIENGILPPTTPPY